MFINLVSLIKQEQNKTNKNKQTDKQTNKINKQTNKPTNEQTNFPTLQIVLSLTDTFT